MIPVTKSFLPPIEDYTAQLQRAYSKEWLTNRGTLLIELEEKLKVYLNVRNILIMNNGTIPIQIALKLLAGSGEVITTPFSYVATTSSIVWEGSTPIFVDINESNLTIDVAKIEAAITPKTRCILATHVFGNPCDIDAIQAIANKHNLKVIYDAAHCFGVKYKGESIFNFGDVATCSFHATKLFHTGEGGAIFSNDEDLRKKIFYSHNFGHNGPLDFHGLGINGKQSELHAAMGLAVLPYMNHILEKRKIIVDYYLENLTKDKIRFMQLSKDCEWNYSYFPVIFESEEQLNSVQRKLNEKEIFPRRYFYPSLNRLPYLQAPEMPVAEKISSCILCLPLYTSLTQYEQIVSLINAELE
jgi:dTDP-4-amino-4,6-dideoxygalactose transaminase